MESTSPSTENEQTCAYMDLSVKVTLYDFPGSSGFFLVLSEHGLSVCSLLGHSLSEPRRPAVRSPHHPWLHVGGSQSSWAQSLDDLSPGAWHVSHKGFRRLWPHICVSLPQHWGCPCSWSSICCGDKPALLTPSEFLLHRIQEHMTGCCFTPLSLGWFTGQ